MTQKSKLIVGIDLGTTNSSAAIYADKEIKIIQASGSRAETYRVNQKMFPSVVFIGEDKEIIVINKPSGLTVHPGAGQKKLTLTNLGSLLIFPGPV